jgi:hypothetical protein
MKVLRRLPLLVALALAALLPPRGGLAGDYRKFSWGVAIDEVKDKERDFRFFYRGEDKLYYKGRVAGYPAAIIYLFTDSRLSEVTVLIEQKHTNNQEFIADYKKLLGLLSEKYGKPAKEEQVWSGGDFLRHNQDVWGDAVAGGYLEFRAQWQDERTAIQLILGGDNMHVSLGITYSDRKAEKAKASPPSATKDL